MQRGFRKVLFGVMAGILLSNSSLAFTPETDCPSVVTVSTQKELTTALADDKFGSASPYLKDDKYVVCLNGVVKINKTLNVGGKDKSLVIYGLSLKAGDITNPLTEETSKYDGLFLSVSGANVTLQNLVIAKIVTEEGLEYWPTHALSLTGSNISILDSTIHASQTGISIVGTAAQAAENITIRGTTITGQGIAGSKGVSIESGKGVSIAGNDTIDNMIYGVHIKSGTGVNVTETTFKIADTSKAIFWEGGDKPVVTVL